ncbi:MAG: carboxypeptidase regulatory-like domain-containing protein [Rhodocyclales bacterium]|nr:carboxypeptidase regulatory-like domain-containing protein [Rhodocyclales bacterium]
MTKQFTPNVVKPGSRSRLRLTFYNPTGLAISSLQVTDTMPAGVTIPSGPNPTTTCTGATVTSPAVNQVHVEGASLPATVNATCYAEIDVYVAAQNDYTNVIPAGDVSALSGSSVVKNSQPTSDVLRARQPIVVHKAITSLTLDSGNPSGFTTGSASTTPGTAATLTIRLTNPNAAASNTDGALNAVAFTDTLPSNLVIAQTPNASTTCSGGLLLASASGTTIRLSGAMIPAGASCDVKVDVLSNTPGSYTNTIAAGALYSYEGVTNEEATSARLVVSAPPAVAKQFSPAVMSSGGKSTLTIYLNNSNTTAATLTSDLVDTLPNTPGAMTVLSPNGLSTTCPGTVSAPAGGTTITYPTGALVPAGGCSISVDVTATTAGDYTNYIPVGALKTTHGFNQTQASATVSVSAQGFISGRVFQDNSVTPDGVYQAGTDAPLSGISMQLRSGNTCAGTLLATGSTDSQGTYLFSGLAVGTYSVCQTAQPSGTVNGITTAGTIQTVNGSTGTAGAASNPTSTTSQIAGIVLNGGGSGGEISGAINNNFAEVVQSTLSGQVFLDQNNNGVLNAADSGISGVAIQLLNGSGTVVASTTTDSSGNYSFANLTPGTYSIVEPTQPAGTSNGLTVAGSVGNGGSAGTVSGLTTLPSRISTLILPPNTTSTGNNFAEIPNTRTVSGKVFLDINNNGAFNSGSDSGIAGQTVTLTGTDINGNPVSLSATTTADGSYIFNAVPEGSNYTLNQPSQPTGTVNGTTTAGSAGGSASNPTATSSRITGISLTGSTTVSSDNNFAETSVPPSVGKQFSPAVISAGDKSTLTIYLTNTTPVAATLTSALVDTLPTTPGPLVVATPNNLSTTCPGSPVAVAGSGTVSYPSGATLPAGGCSISVDVTTTTSGNYVNTIPVGALQTTLGNNAAAATAPLQVNSKGYISGRVFQDNSVTPDGIYQAGTDTPLAGVSIELRNGANCAGSLVSTTPTDSVGNYLFSLLSAGTYSVCQPSQPSGSVNGITTAGSIVSVSGSTGSAGAASNPTSTSSQIAGIVLNANGGGTAISGAINNNFAEVVQSTISGTVFRDQNNNGVQNAGDTGIAGVTVQLLNASNTVVATTTTDASGNYSFSNLNPGTYSILEPTQPADTSNGVTVAGSVGNGGTAGTASATTTLPSRISTLVLPPNTTSSGNNFAEIANNRTLSGRVFLDYNNNGSFNSGTDQGLGGQVITLTGTDINGNPVSLTTTTASDGTYTFSNVPEGTNYTLTQGSQPAGTSNGTTTAGTAGGTGSNPTSTTSRITGINLSGSTTGSANNNFAELPGAIPDLAISKTHTPSSFGDGSSTGAFTISPSNVGSVATSGSISVVDTLPAGLTPTSASGTGWACAIAGQVVTCTSSNVIAATGSGTPITIKVKVGSGLVGNTLVNTAVISGGGEPSGFESNNTATDSVTIVASASVSGHVWRDTNHNRALDSGETVLAGWGVELLYNGSVIGSTTSDASGAYSFTNLSPGAGYQIRFREPKTGTIFGYPVPNEAGSSYTNGVVSTTNPTGANTSTGVLDSMTLSAGSNVVQQSLPVDPSGVVYDAVTRKPVSGAVVTISGPSGFNESMVVGGSATQTTSTDGIYQFLLTSAAPAGVYTLSITSYPSGYQASTLIPVCSNVLSVGSTPSPALVQNSNEAPATSAATHNAATCPSASSGLAGTAGSTQFYFSFVLTPGVSASVINNHIPLDPLSGGSIVVTKTTPKLNVTRGEMVPYTITATNTLSTAAPNITVRDLMPPGFKYRMGSAILNGSHLEPTVAGRTLSWANQTFAGSEKKTYRLILTVGTGVSEGKYVNTAWALNGLTGNSVSNTATATVQVVPDPTFDCSDIIGKVFDDRNANGYQDEGEPGIPNVRIATVRGLLVTSDADGRFHVACADIPQMDRGSNFIMKLDERTLPSGYRLTTENPRVVRTTRGKMVKLNFGAAIHKVYRLDVDQRAYTDNGEQLRDPWTEQLRLLVLQLQERPAVLRLAYHVGPDEAEEDAHKRQARLSDWIQRLYAERPRQESEADQPQDKERKIPPLVIEMETVATKGAKQ